MEKPPTQNLGVVAIKEGAYGSLSTTVAKFIFSLFLQKLALTTVFNNFFEICR